MRKLLAFTVIIAALCFIFSDTGFHPEKVIYSLPYKPEWNPEPREEKDRELITQIYNQPFHYLGKGARSWAFVSEDGKWVIKFFKNRYLTPHFATLLPDWFPRKRWREQKKNKVSLTRVFDGYALADKYDREGTALVEIHLNQTKTIRKKLACFDKNGNAHFVDLDKAHFVVQKRAETLPEILARLLQAGKQNEAVNTLKQVFSLYKNQWDQGLFDEGNGILRNNGFVDGKAVHYDVGKLILTQKAKDPEVQKEKIAIMQRKIDQWLEKKQLALQ